MGTYLRGSTYNDWNRASQAFASSKECGHEENKNGHRDCGKRKGKLQRFSVDDNDDKLYSKSKEEEEIELQQSDINLSLNVSSAV